ncbi:transcription factor [Ganoderma sinense ZZ0214-1]|uniref:Transcription factor n=1 Tax=Ganoderma sinense ZZ0214-1 TaxID=1077348 RepID=A0A2G8RZS7_9APHY|nr:transcription factor [Ganoderma sinense ZZ0214-1]
MAPIRSQDPHSTAQCCTERTVYEHGAFVKRFFCNLCNGSVKRKGDFQRHMRKHSTERRFLCTWAGCTHTEGFTQKSNMEQHIKSVHLGMRYSCPHSWVAADGTVYECDHEASDPSGLIRHRSLNHGFEAGDDEKKIEKPTPEGMTFPESKYAKGNNKRKADEDDEESAKDPARRAKRSKTTPAPVPSSSSSSSRSASKKKSTRRASAPAHTEEQEFDLSSMYTFSASQSSTPSPITAADWDLGFSNAQSQPATGVSSAKPLTFPYLATPAPVDNLETLLNAAAQTAAVNNWSLGPHMEDFNFSFAASALPSLACNGTIDPSVLMLPAPIVSPKPEQASLANAGYSSAPNFYDPSRAEGMMTTMGWQSYADSTPGSSRESTASPDFSLFDDLSLFMPVPVPDEHTYGSFAW